MLQVGVDTLAASVFIHAYFYAKKWTTVLVAFGDATKAAAMSMPVSELPKLEFPEKAKLIPAH